MSACAARIVRSAIAVKKLAIGKALCTKTGITIASLPVGTPCMVFIIAPTEMFYFKNSLSSLGNE